MMLHFILLTLFKFKHFLCSLQHIVLNLTGTCFDILGEIHQGFALNIFPGFRRISMIFHKKFLRIFMGNCSHFGFFTSNSSELPPKIVRNWHRKFGNFALTFIHPENKSYNWFIKSLHVPFWKVLI